MPLTDADRARLAREWRIDPATIPEARRIDTGLSGVTEPRGWKETRQDDFNRMLRARRLLAADIRSGRRRPDGAPQDDAADGPGVLWHDYTMPVADEDGPEETARFFGIAAE